jgi:hypothetical protein
MAQGDIVVFNQFKEDMGAQLHDLTAAGDVVKLAFIDSTQTPAANANDPRWGAGGTVNYDTNEVSGGAFTAEGADILNTWVETTGTVKFGGTDLATFGKNASNPSTLRWGIFYNSTDAGKRCIAYLDLGAVVDGTAGDLTITFNASGIFTLA